MDLPLTAASRAGKLQVVNLLLEAGDHLDKVRMGGLAARFFHACLSMVEHG